MVVHGTYESIEERRAVAAGRCKQLKQQLRDQHQAVRQAEDALQEQEATVAAMKQAYAAFAYLAVSLSDEVPRAKVHVEAAQALSEHYPKTPLFASEATRLVAGFQQCVQEQAGMAESARQDMAAAAQQLTAAQHMLPELHQHVEQAKQHLKDVTEQHRVSMSEYKLLLFPKQWSRYRW